MLKRFWRWLFQRQESMQYRPPSAPVALSMSAVLYVSNLRESILPDDDLPSWEQQTEPIPRWQAYDPYDQYATQPMPRCDFSRK